MNPPGPQPSAPPAAIPALPQFPQRHQRAPIEVFLNSLGAFMLRELKNRFGQFRLGYLWAVVEPALGVAILVVLFVYVRGHKARIYDEEPEYFFVLGVISFLMFQHGFDRSLGSISQNRGLFNYRQVRPIDIVLVRTILEFLIFGGVFVLFLLIGVWFGMEFRFVDPLAFAGYAAVLFVFTFGLALSAEVAMTLYPDTRRFIGLLMRPMLFISGVFFTIEMLSPALQQYLLWNPVLHAVDLMRGAAMAGYESPGSLGYLSLCAICSLLVGLSAYRRYLHRLY